MKDLAERNLAISMHSIRERVLRAPVRFVRQYWRHPARDLGEYTSRLTGKTALEIGGPSEIFSDRGPLPIYSVLACADNCLFSAQTIWTGQVESGRSYHYHPQKTSGTQIFCEATDLRQVPSSRYDVVLASHCLEHIANPLRALEEWKRVLVNDGILLLILPHKAGTFDWRRPITRLEHMIEDFEGNVGESDLTHLPEILSLHDLKKDPGAGSPEKFRQRCLENHLHRALHHHVFDTQTAAMLVDHSGFQLIRVTAMKPFHIVILAARCDNGCRNSEFLLPTAAYHDQSPFLADRRSSS